MLRLPPFRYLAPRDVEQAVHMLAKEGEQAMLVAGGKSIGCVFLAPLAVQRFLPIGAALAVAVRFPAAAAGWSETTSARSRRDGFSPQATPPKRKPFGIFTR